MTSNRNPKSLRDFIEKSKLDVDEINLSSKTDFEESLKNLKHLSQEEKSELGMLKSRVEEQSRLIMILKTRGDDYLKKNSTLEKMNQDLHDQKDELENECKLANNNYKSLLDKFDYLANNHQELIKIKDEYKNKNSELTIKYVQLLDKMKNVPSEEVFELERNALNEKIDRLNQICLEHETKLTILRDENENYVKKLKVEMEISENKERELSILMNQNNQLNSKNKELMEHLERLKEESIKTNENSLKQIEESTKRNNELNLLCECLKKEKVVLQENHLNLEKNYKNLQHEFNKIKEAFNRDVLHDELEEAQKKYQDLQKQFDAYKHYTNGLLEKERQLNNKLKFMVS